MFSFSAKPEVSKEVALKDQVRAWTRDLGSQERELDRQIRAIEREREKFVREAKTAARKGDTITVKGIAKNYAMGGKMIEKLMITKATLNSVKMTLQTQYAVQKVAGVMGKSTAIMKSMRQLVSAPEIAGVMRRMGEEMQRAGIIEEMMSEAMEAAEPEGLDAEADEVTEQVMFEITGGMIGTAPAGPIKGLPTAAKAPAVSTGAAAAPARVAVLEGGGGAVGGAGASSVDSDLEALRARMGRLGTGKE